MNGSESVLSLTSDDTTVVGTVALCQPVGTKAAVEMVSPLASTLEEDCNVQWSRRRSLAAGATGPDGLGAVRSAARRQCEPRIEITNHRARMCSEKNARFFVAEFIVLPCVQELEHESERPRRTEGRE